MKNELEKHILAHFQSALGRGYIQPYYQPVVRTISRQLCSFEALARWVDPALGVIRPDQFIPVLEEKRLIHLLDSSIIRQVCARMRRTIDEGGVPIPVSVNLSRLDFSLCDIFSVVDGIAAKYQIPHDFLYIEITESIIAEDEGKMGSIVEKFRSAGYQVWMDDFGSAYSSLNLLKDFEFDELKLDMQFLSSFNQRSRKILTAVIQMAKEIDIHTLAEGVETQEQMDFLRNIGCEKVQGYYFGRPMPFDEALAHLRDIGVAVETPQDRNYYDDIGKVNFLSAVPFMTRQQRDALTDARQLNNIPLAMAEVRGDDFSVLFCNSAFENMLSGTGMSADIFSQQTLRQPRPLTMLPPRLAHLMDSTRTDGSGRLFFISNDEYYEIKSQCVARKKDAYSVLFRLLNLSRASKASRTNVLDESLRQIFTFFERITLVDVNADAIKPLYVGTQMDMLSGRKNIRKLADEFARRWIFQDDRQDYLTFIDMDSLEARLQESGRTYLSVYLRANVGHGQYAWKLFSLLKLRPGVYLELIRNVHNDLVAINAKFRTAAAPAQDGIFSPEHLWHTLVQSDIIRVFWKDADRRFMGASKAFLDYYGFDSLQDILGKNDEELGWHTHPESYMNDELRVLREGVTTYNMPGRCICDGENRDIIASKTPIYDENGAVKGLLGQFVDRDLLNENDSRGKESKRRDMLTGLLNTRGIAEEAQLFEDEYNLRNIDFIRLHVTIDDFASLNKQYGFDFGDKAIAALGRALKKAFGRTAAVGRLTGHQLVILHQIKGPEEIKTIRDRVKKIASGIQRIDGVALTLYLSVGYSAYSEFEDLEEQAKKTEIRLLADHDEHATMENRLARSSEIFHLYDDLPISYSVYKVLLDENRDVRDAVLFYVNHVFEERADRTAPDLLGRRVSELFPTLDHSWYEKARRAAWDGETVVDKLHFAPMDKYYYMTMSPIIHAGYCCVTYQEIELLNAVRGDETAQR